MCFKLPGAPGQSSPLRLLGLRSGFEPSGLDRPGRLPHQQGLCEARLGYRAGPHTMLLLYFKCL